MKLQEVIAYEWRALHRRAFCHYVRTGEDEGLLSLQEKIRPRNFNEGGYFATSYISKEIIRILTARSAMRQIASVDVMSPPSMTVLIGENKKTIYVHELYAQARYLQKQLDKLTLDVKDGNIEDWLVDKVTDSFSKDENSAFINGSGVGKPRGSVSQRPRQYVQNMHHVRGRGDPALNLNMRYYYGCKNFKRRVDN